MAQDKYLTYRGDLKAVAAVGSSVLFVTAHAQGQATALYRLDGEKLTLGEEALPAGGLALATDGQTAWVAGSDRRIYRLPIAGGKPVALKATLEADPIAITLLANEKLAVLAGDQVLILSTKGEIAQTLNLPEIGSALAADPSGNWLVAGTTKGTVLVFDSEDRSEFLLSESAKLHEGAVTALLFETDDLRFLSAGADGKLLSTHARGKLEPEDKGRGNNHTERVTALLWAPGDRFLSGGRDATIKSWPRVGGVKPATTKDGLSKVNGLALLQVGQRMFVVAIGDDNAIRFLPLDAAGKVGELSHRLHGASAWAQNELASDEVKRREAALRQLTQWNDDASITLIAQDIQADADHGLRLLATQLLAGSGHPRAAQLLETALKHSDEAVRIEAFNGLRKLRGEQDLRTLDSAIASEKPDIGRLAAAALGKLAASDDQALVLLTQALERNPFEIRQAAMAALETVHADDSPTAQIVALGSRHADIRRLALVRLHQRSLYREARVQTALRKATEDADGDVRRTAFLLSLYTRDRLVPVLRGRDAELDRQLTDLENAGPDATAAGTKPPAEAAQPADATIAATPKALKEPKKAKKPAAAKDVGDALEPADYEPLLQATASRALDTCLRGARALAVLGDERALGLLLQLSREKETSARVEVARALAALNDPRSVGRLRSLLFDTDAGVRDAAFSALAKLADADPLSAADAGLGATHEDVRRRGLQAVISVARKKLPESADDPAWPMLIRALNDASAAVRSEAFKSSLNLQIGGGGMNTLRFVLQSVHADVRREVLTEVMAQVEQSWANNLLLDFLNDPDPKLREEAFEFATKKSKETAPLEAALKSKYPDVRRKAVEALVKKHSKPAQELLVTALSDENITVRLNAIDALIGDDAREALRAALNSPHDDIHARAATALALHGETIALKPLLELASAAEPQGQPAERVAAWVSLVETALQGLAELGDSSALNQVRQLIDSSHNKIRHAAARALPWLAMAQHPGSLRQAMQHADPQVRFNAALGLALAGEGSSAPIIFSTEGTKTLSAAQRVMAAVPLGPAGEDQLIAFLDNSEERTRDHAMLVLMLLELKTSGGVPSRCLACLAAREPRVRLRAARALDCFRDPALFLQFVTRLFTERGEAKAWDISSSTVDSVAELVAFASPAIRARTILLLTQLFEKEQAAWDNAWAVHEARFAGEIAKLKKATATRPQVAPVYTPEQLDELAFGAYVGLVREQGADAQASARVRQTALAWLMEMARRNPAYVLSAQAVFMQALRDPSQPVRAQAFDQFAALGVDPTVVGAEAIEVGYLDQGVRGLELLSKAGGGKASIAGAKVLEQAMLTRADDLSIEAAKLLTQQRDVTVVATVALTAVHEPLRQQAVLWLAAEYDKSPEAQKQLRTALTSRYGKVREDAAMELATKKDAAAFEALVKLLTEAEKEPRQRLIVAALTRLGDPRTPNALLDRLENDPAKTAAAGLLLAAAGTFRQPAVADRMLDLLDRNAAWRLPAGNALLTISGYDQPIEDADEVSGDRTWEKKQFPRHDRVLAALMEKSLALSATDRLLKMVPHARWARAKEVDPVLARLAAHPDERLRREAIEAVGWRARKRKAGTEPLLAALSHRDPTSQFLAAEGLARNGRGEGLSVLLSAIDFLQDVPLRRRAGEALGELGDVRAIDTLLKLATEEGHVLQDVAAEAIGRLGQTPAGDEVFKLLERLTKGSAHVGSKALRGLRWLDSADAWQLIRQVAHTGLPILAQTAAELLQFDDNPATRDLLLRIVRESDDAYLVQIAFQSVKATSKENDLELHYAWLQNPLAEEHEIGDSIKLVAERGDAAKIFDMFPRLTHRQHILTGLLARPTPPVAEAAAVVKDVDASNDFRRIEAAARILGRAGGQHAAVKKAGQDLATRIAYYRGSAITLAESTKDDDQARAEGVTAALASLLWAAGRLGVAEEELISTFTDFCQSAGYRPARQAAASALIAGGFKSEKAIAALEAAAVGDSPDLRKLAAGALAKLQPKRAANLAEKVLPDRISFNRMAKDVRQAGGSLGNVLTPAVAQGHYQGIAIPQVIATGDISVLSTVADDRKLPPATRLGAIEALGKLASEAAEAKLRAIGANPQEDESLRKAAWSALRRSKRVRTPKPRKVVMP